MYRFRATLLALALVGATTTGLASQTTAGPSLTIKDPDVARTQAVRCPGCGHIYTGETTKGLVIASVGFGSFLGASVLTLTSDPSVECSSSGLDVTCKENSVGYTPLILGGLALAGSWIYGLIDAGPSAERANAKAGVQLGSLEVEPVIAPSAGRGTAVGLQIRLGN